MLKRSLQILRWHRKKSFNQTNKNLEDLSANEVIYFIFNKLNRRGLSLTIEEIEPSKKLRKSPEKLLSTDL